MSTASTVSKGTAGQYLTVADLMLSGIVPSEPLLSDSIYDILADCDGQLLKIQVKSGYSDGGRLKVEVRRPSAQKRTYETGSYDILAAVDLKSRRVAYIPKSEITSSRQITIFLSKGLYSTVGKKADYAPLFFDDLIDIRNAALVS